MSPRIFRIGHMKRLLTRCWRWLITDPNPNDPDRNSTAWN